MEPKIDAPATELFRSEAVKFQAARLQGEVFLKLRSPWLLIGFVCAGLAIAMVLAASFTSYARKERATGALVLVEGAVRLSIDEPAVVRRVWVHDGERVAAGQPLVSVEPLGSPQPSAVRNLLAPVDLTVGVVNVSAGQTVAAGHTLIELFADTGRLEAELRILPAAMSFIRPGQSVMLRYDAFPYRKFGSGQGEIVSVSQTPVSVSAENPAGFYRGRVALERDHVEAFGERIPLRPGMSLEAEVIIDERPLSEWLLEPLYAIGARR
jgi:multidrug efflux pump subunit AcrA (membrane-fusion protein)